MARSRPRRATARQPRSSDARRNTLARPVGADHVLKPDEPIEPMGSIHCALQSASRLVTLAGNVSEYAVQGEAQAEVPRHGEGSVVLGGGLVLLVPRQLARAGMTGDVPYYGGRLSPAQAYAASHPRQTAGAAQPPPAPPPAPPSPAKQAAQLEALQRLRDDGLISDAEHTRLASRVTG